MDYAKPVNIMIIDDDEINNFIVKTLIRKVCKSTKVTICLNITNAIDLLLSINHESGSLPEFIFLELFSQLMNGWDFLDEYSRLNFDKTGVRRIIILTCSTFKRDIDRALSYLSVIEFITKPVTADRLKSLFCKII